MSKLIKNYNLIDKIIDFYLREFYFMSIFDLIKYLYRLK